MRRPTKVVAFGGGRGLAASLTALSSLDNIDLTAVVTVADDGGSSGQIRATRPVLPPGDLRKALIATADPTRVSLTEVFGHRFEGTDFLAGHPVGNIILTALLERYPNPVEALDRAAEALGCRARILPMANERLDIEADICLNGADHVIHGQHNVAVNPGRVDRLRITPVDVEPCPEAKEAIGQADWHIFGPGSWYTSVIPHLLLPKLRDAVKAASARRAVVVNLAEENETTGLSLPGHLQALADFASGVRFHYVIADDTRCSNEARSLNQAAQSLSAQLVLGRVAADSTSHDPQALAKVLGNLLHDEGGS
ncbi:gluconeogenesis factor YvcK family protein [Natronoglycomyces albus]|uniref:YvcK family protein n=1 Tax=Natronoglycomyces albus TaxID=2811108 RepID=A0A895XLP1_9ACTN|nr:uridine diphosphate-N-acetylglucosamine-binding protein YvcK [Natronoglycomyces albus]QSB03875.1 YvcK family protein [Natronoglycomyces albus]